MDRPKTEEKLTKVLIGFLKECIVVVKLILKFVLNAVDGQKKRNAILCLKNYKHLKHNNETHLLKSHSAGWEMKTNFAPEPE